MKKNKKLQEAAKKLADEINERGDYRTACPHCGGQIMLTGFMASCNVPVQLDGWCYDDGPIDSTDEQFACGDCGKPISGGFVFKVEGAKP